MALVHAIAKSYGRFPHEVLDLDPFQVSLAALCVQEAENSRARTAQHLREQSSGGLVPMPVPVVVVGG